MYGEEPGKLQICLPKVRASRRSEIFLRCIKIPVGPRPEKQTPLQPSQSNNQVSFPFCNHVTAIKPNANLVKRWVTARLGPKQCQAFTQLDQGSPYLDTH